LLYPFNFYVTRRGITDWGHRSYQWMLLMDMTSGWPAKECFGVLLRICSSTPQNSLI